MQISIVCNIMIYLQNEFYMLPEITRQKKEKSHCLQYYELSPE